VNQQRPLPYDDSLTLLLSEHSCYCNNQYIGIVNQQLPLTYDDSLTLLLSEHSCYCNNQYIGIVNQQRPLTYDDSLTLLLSEHEHSCYCDNQYISTPLHQLLRPSPLGRHASITQCNRHSRVSTEIAYVITAIPVNSISTLSAQNITTMFKLHQHSLHWL